MSTTTETATDENWVYFYFMPVGCLAKFAYPLRIGSRYDRPVGKFMSDFIVEHSYVPGHFKFLYNGKYLTGTETLVSLCMHKTASPNLIFVTFATNEPS